MIWRLTALLLIVSAMCLAAQQPTTGPVFLIAGQSQASGRATHLQLYSSTIPAYMFGNDYVWKALRDPTDANTGQIDTISWDVGAHGSAWPILASYATKETGVPLAIVPCAKGSTKISQWMPRTDHFNRNTLYGSLAYRGKQVKRLHAVLWWQGTADAVAYTTKAQYHDYIARLAAAVGVDLGVPLMVAKNERWNNLTLAQQAPINAAIEQAYGDVPNIVRGPDLSNLISEGNQPHFLTDADMNEAGLRWWRAIQAASLQ